jgi:5-methylcytosine-specific restriction protein A
LLRELVVVATEVDHVDGNSQNNLFANLRSLCKPCHSAKTARENGSFGNQRKE